MEASLILYKRKIKKMIEKLSDLLHDKSKMVYKDNLDFLTSIKSEVESLVKSVDKFTLSLCRDPHLVSKKTRQSMIVGASQKESKIIKEGAGNRISKTKTEPIDQNNQHFRNDTFNSKFSRHVKNIEKFISNESAHKSSHFFIEVLRVNERKRVLDPRPNKNL